MRKRFCFVLPVFRFVAKRFVPIRDGGRGETKIFGPVAAPLSNGSREPRRSDFPGAKKVADFGA